MEGEWQDVHMLTAVAQWGACVLCTGSEWEVRFAQVHMHQQSDMGVAMGKGESVVGGGHEQVGVHLWGPLCWNALTVRSSFSLQEL